ncbi:MAG: hypothetical protein HYU25_01895 [Candidatus Rokubacteria bacterium]|nr:hypothetical protein [Candidatus Rokubacteria bacterium]
MAKSGEAIEVVDLGKPVETSTRVRETVGRARPGQVVKAVTSTRRDPVSDGVAARIPRPA